MRFNRRLGLYVPSGVPAPSDPYWANVVLLLDASSYADGSTPSTLDVTGKTPTYRLSIDGGRTFSRAYQMPSNGVVDLYTYAGGRTPQALGIRATFAAGSLAQSLYGAIKIAGATTDGDMVFNLKSSGVTVTVVVVTSPAPEIETVSTTGSPAASTPVTVCVCATVPMPDVIFSGSGASGALQPVVRLSAAPAAAVAWRVNVGSARESEPRESGPVVAGAFVTEPIEPGTDARTRIM